MNIASILTLFGALCFHSHYCKIMTTPESQKIMERLFDDKNFARWAIPSHPGKEVMVRISLTFIDMVPLDFFYNHIFIEVIIHQEWKDERLMFNSSLPNASIILTGENVNDIWLPDTWITNERGEPRDRFPPNESKVQLKSDGYVYYSARFSIYVFCPMNYTYFPFDRQQCVLPIESYAYNTEMMRLMPNEMLPVSFRDDFRIKEFILDQSKGVEVATSQIDYGLTGTFDRVEIRLLLRRHVYYYIVEYFFPLALVVATSWISFWIDYRCTSARATLPVTTFLTLTSMAETLRAKDAGSLSYSTVFEIYINVCTFYVFAALIEYAVIRSSNHFLKRATKNLKQEASRDSHKNASLRINKDSTDKPLSNGEAVEVEDMNQDEKERTNEFQSILEKEQYFYEDNHGYSILDEYSKAIFPISFIIFVICYAVVCTSVQ